MKLIFIDFLRRWKWVYVLVGALQFCAILFLSPISSLFLVIYCGSFLLLFDLNRGIARVFQSFPIKRKELARSWWILAVMVPFVFSAAILALTTLARLAFGYPLLLPVAQLVLWATLSFLWLGTSFYLLTHLTANTPGISSGNLKTGIVGGLWGTSLGGGFFLFMTMPQQWRSLEPWHWWLLFAGIACSYFGWLRSEFIALNRSRTVQNRGSSKLPRNTEKSFILSDGGSGFISLLRRQTGTSLKTIAFFLLVFLGFQIFLRRQPNESFLLAAARIVKEPVTGFIIGPMVIITGLQWFSGIRFMRSLPQTS